MTCNTLGGNQCCCRQVTSYCWLLCTKHGCALQVQPSCASWYIQCLNILLSYKQDQKKLGPSPSSKSYSVQQRTGSRKKQSKAVHKSQTPIRVQQRVHPGMSSSQNRTTAHYGAVTGLRTTTDGMHLLSSGWVNLFSVVLNRCCVARPEISMQRTDDTLRAVIKKTLSFHFRIWFSIKDMGYWFRMQYFGQFRSHAIAA
jgi:hypothetical protein